MKNIIMKSLAGAGLLVFSLTASAQDRDRDRDRDRDNDSYHHDRDDAFRGEWRGHLFERVRADLDHVQTVTFPFSRDEYRLTRTKQELNELQDKLANRQYDERELDEVISALSRVVSDNRLSPRDRDILSDDLNRLREYREHHEGWGRDER
jgi:hypothetical protein